MDMIRDASVAGLKSRFYRFGSFESFAGHIPIIPFLRTYSNICTQAGLQIASVRFGSSILVEK
jgi:hypothetical protein